MTLNEYQNKAMETCMPSCFNDSYMMGLLQEESGELQGKVNKAIRTKFITIKDGMITFSFPKDLEAIEDFDTLLEKELGDVLWACAGIASVRGWKLGDVATNNLEKLASRKQRGVIAGEGDNR
jgi:NTP pyrophosphatase (non-canonical NTP hydrolase)